MGLKYALTAKGQIKRQYFVPLGLLKSRDNNIYILLPRFFNPIQAIMAPPTTFLLITFEQELILP